MSWFAVQRSPAPTRGHGALLPRLHKHRQKSLLLAPRLHLTSMCKASMCHCQRLLTLGLGSIPLRATCLAHALRRLTASKGCAQRSHEFGYSLPRDIVAHARVVTACMHACALLLRDLACADRGIEGGLPRRGGEVRRDARPVDVHPCTPMLYI